MSLKRESLEAQKSRDVHLLDICSVWIIMQHQQRPKHWQNIYITIVQHITHEKI